MPVDPTLRRLTENFSSIERTLRNLGTEAGLARTLTATADLSFDRVVARSDQEETIPCEGARVGDVVHLGPPSNLAAGLSPTGYVSEDDVVSVRVSNITNTDMAPAVGTWRVMVAGF